MNVTVLHVVSNPAAVASCLAAAGEDDAVLLVGDGVFAHGVAEGSGIRVGVLADDTASRGLRPSTGLESLSYGDFVEWVVKFPKTVTWR